MDIIRHGKKYETLEKDVFECPDCGCQFILDLDDEIAIQTFKKQESYLNDLKAYCPECGLFLIEEHIVGKYYFKKDKGWTISIDLSKSKRNYEKQNID